jgi:hypothetical protein
MRENTASGGLVPCTLFSGHYHLGVGALANSLYRGGFRGTMCIGYVLALPPWAAGARRDGDDSILEVKNDFILRFIPWSTNRNLSLDKARFLLHVLDHAFPNAEAALFFDADVTTHGSWKFFSNWVRQGMALCVDAGFPLVPAGHPWRQSWRALAAEAGYDHHRDLEHYVNSGFVGVPRAQRETVQCWAALIDHFLQRRGSINNSVKFAERDDAFVGDQDMLNAALMATSAPLSIIGLEGMDFKPSGYTMSHAIDSAKPWEKNFILQALAGHPPAPADKTFWRFADHPIQLFSSSRLAMARLAISTASAIGRFYRRS